MITFDSIRDIKICQYKDGYRFSIDALLLFSFVNLQRVYNIVDLGAGSGIIGILLAKKYPNAQVTLVELQQRLARLSERNIFDNELIGRVQVVNKDIVELLEVKEYYGKYDVVVSNPPFRKLNTGVVSCVDERAIARHEIKISLADLIKTSSYLLKSNGRLFIIYLPERLVEVFAVMRKHSLEVKRLKFIHSKVSTDSKMVLIEAVKDGKQSLKVESPFFIYDEEGKYTQQALQLFGD
ncbi:MAG: tRNA1(Val) (adenine(37)-N6)-methyltransferase [Thermodesulfovibrionales bacterium]|nr:tRNA1(Val) (adenine(37)-N6)-methyltransferase [Thermodesulfovibrionales bacterium]